MISHVGVKPKTLVSSSPFYLFLGNKICWFGENDVPLYSILTLMTMSLKKPQMLVITREKLEVVRFTVDFTPTVKGELKNIKVY